MYRQNILTDYKTTKEEVLLTCHSPEERVDIVKNTYHSYFSFKPLKYCWKNPIEIWNQQKQQWEDYSSYKANNSLKSVLDKPINVFTKTQDDYFVITITNIYTGYVVCHIKFLKDLDN